MKAVVGARHRTLDGLVVTDNLTADRFLEMKQGVDRILEYLKVLGKYGFRKICHKDDRSALYIDCEIRYLNVQTVVSTNGIRLDTSWTTEISTLLKKFMVMHAGDPHGHLHLLGFVFGLSEQTTHEKHQSLLAALSGRKGI
jgi:hypothetical protein